MEQWKTIEGYGDIYEVSNNGNIRTFYHMPRGRYRNGIIMQKGTQSYEVPLFQSTNGYTCVDFTTRIGGRQRKRKLVHQLVAKAFLPPPPDATHRWVVNHKDGDRTNAKATNLEWVSDAQNAKHRVPNKANAFLIKLNPISAARTIAKKYNKDDIIALIEELQKAL